MEIPGQFSKEIDSLEKREGGFGLRVNGSIKGLRHHPPDWSIIWTICH
jgi:hypothetical protein